MPGPLYPVFMRDSATGKLNLSNSTIGQHEWDLRGKRRDYIKPLSPEEVDRAAKQSVRRRQGDEKNEKDVLGEYVLQFGRMHGFTFRWLLENLPGYVGWFVSSTIAEEGIKEDKSSQHSKDSKEALKRYVLMFEEGRELVQRKSRPQSAPRITAALKQLVNISKKVSPEQLKRQVQKIRSPPKFQPNIVTSADRELMHCMDEFEAAQSTVSKPLPSTTPPTPTPTPQTTETKAKKSLFQDKTAVLAPPPHHKLPAHTYPAIKDNERKTTGTQCKPVPPVHSHSANQDKGKKPVLPTQSVVEDTETHLPQPQRCPSISADLGCSEIPVERLAVTPVAESPLLVPPIVDSLACEQSGAVQDISSTSDVTEPVMYEKWRSTLPKIDHNWVSKSFFRLSIANKVEFRAERVTQLWNNPPTPSLTARNRVDRYFAHRLFLWMPLNIWSVRLTCPHTDADNHQCQGVLTRAGMHQKTRLVIDIDSNYNIASEYLRCSKCGRKMVAWAHNIVSQLDRDRQLMFPAILTAKYSCDKKVVGLLRQRGLGNSSSMVRRQLEESHGDTYLRKVHHYLTSCRAFKTADSLGLLSNPSPDEPPALTPVPQHRWLMKVYQLDVLQRLDFIKASLTSTFGRVLKLDSTKKITKKLAGKSAKTAMWATNIGNEHGQVIMSVLTANEGEGLTDMITGILNRYQNAHVPAPKLLYVDRDCCGSKCIHKYFTGWPYLLVRLDIWHFMRRLASGCTTDAHPLYSIFMGRLSHSIFEWEEEDVDLLKKAKRAEMIRQHTNPSDADVVRHIKKEELALHCRRKTRGTQETTSLVDDLINSLAGDKGKDILGVPLFDEGKMGEIWAKLKHHVPCIQDPEDFQLYTRTGTMKKGGIEVPQYRCARGSTSLENFHLHMNRFIPGTLASDVNFQVYLLDGIHRWNQDRKRDATTGQVFKGPLSYDGTLQHAVNLLSREMLHSQICSDFLVPGKYTGELIGLEYLYSQSTGATVNYMDTTRSIEEDTEQEADNAEEEDDEGFEETSQLQDLTVPVLQSDEPLTNPVLRIPSSTEYRELVSMVSNSDSVLQLPMPAATDAQTRPPPASCGQPKHHPEQSPSTSGQLEVPVQLSPATARQSVPPQNQNLHIDDSDIGPDNIPGYSHVQELASFLVTLRDQEHNISTEQACTVIKLWESLSEYDKSGTKFPDRFSTPGTGRFRSRKKHVALGVVSIERAVLGPNATRSSWPDCNRYVEATITKLLQMYPSDRRSKKEKFCSRWSLVKQAYGHIQSLVLSCNRLLENTRIQLPSLNIKTIQQWYNKRGKERDLKILVQGLQLPQASMTGTGAPRPKPKPVTLQSGVSSPFLFSCPPDTAGEVKLKVRKSFPTCTSSQPQRSILPMPCSPVFSPFPVVQSTNMVPVPGTVQSKKRKQVTQEHAEHGMVKRKYNKSTATKKCAKCGEERHPPTHQQYMGYRYCQKTEALAFEEWRNDLKEKGVARKKKE